MKIKLRKHTSGSAMYPQPAPSFTSPNQSDEIRSESDLREGKKERGER